MRRIGIVAEGQKEAIRNALECEIARSIGIINAKVDNNCLDGEFKANLKDGMSVVGNFTDAPVIKEVGEHVETPAESNGHIVGVRDGNVFGFSYFDASGQSYGSFLAAVVEK